VAVGPDGRVGLADHEGSGDPDAGAWQGDRRVTNGGCLEMPGVFRSEKLLCHLVVIPQASQLFVVFRVY
jgi:hypothetical protein